MQGFTGGVEEYGDSLASHYLGSDVDEVDTKPVDPAEQQMYRKMRTYGVQATPVQDVRLAGGGRYFSKQMGTPRIKPDRRFPFTSAIERPDWAKPLIYARQSRNAPPTPPPPTERPRGEGPLPADKQAMIPFDMSPGDKETIIGLMGQRVTLPLSSATRSIADLNSGIGSDAALRGVHFDPETAVTAQQRGVNKRTGKMYTDREIGEMEFKIAKGAAMRDLMRPVGSSERGTGWQVMQTNEEGKTVVLGAKSGDTVEDKGALPGRLESNMPPLNPGPVRKQATEVRSSVMPGYDPTGEKGLYPEGHEELQAEVTKNLSRMTPAEAIASGSMLESMAIAAGRGNRAALEGSLRAGSSAAASIRASQGRAQQQKGYWSDRFREQQAAIARNRAASRHSTQLREGSQTADAAMTPEEASDVAAIKEKFGNKKTTPLIAPSTKSKDKDTTKSKSKSKSTKKK